MEVIKTKLKDYNNQRKKIRKKAIKPTQVGRSNEMPQSKQRKTTGNKHRITEDEMAILSFLKTYKDKLPNNAITSVREQLSEVWTVKKCEIGRIIIKIDNI